YAAARLYLAAQFPALRGSAPAAVVSPQSWGSLLNFQPRVVYPFHYRNQDPGIFKTIVEAASDTVEVRMRNWYP
ncbi:MAG: hypothetical protein JXP34_12500, partial [Planctomycetes bacterium]|nr:hypothetical protein [Planctomycetota bacterium]